ncbi:hypothetical protein LIQ25_22705 [Blautia glucerasea]|uniref:hypothetical protein n=2 Tax=Lachnospiraceae TaxID=186803 RepID=UPI001D031CE1|nr:hypothetical protein [Blautia glucerasea]MCB5385202.1 hypothetical protein [Blautia glucerasea]DAJ22401.1 MAG TPA: hypothetical protein [Siphoviridae sp. ct7ub6]
MALPADGQNANDLTKVTEIPAGKELIFFDPTTNEGGIITLENLTKQILNGLTKQTFALDAGQQTILQALNTLNSDSLPNIAERITQMPDGTKAKLLSVGGTSVNVGNTGEKIPAWSFGIFLPSTYGSDACAIFANTNQITVAYKSSNNWVSCKKILY